MEENSQAALGKTLLTEMAEAFCEIIIKGGFKAGVYSSLSWFTSYLDYKKLKSKYSIWLAQWYTTYQLDCDIWQNSETGKISGVSGNVDTNVIVNTKFLENPKEVGPVKPNPITKPTAPTTKKPNLGTVQNWLNKNYGAGISNTSKYNKKTKMGLIKALQIELNKRYGSDLKVDGIFGSKTKAAIRNIKKGMTGDYPKVLQGFLICEGYDTNGFDGIIGDATVRAIKSYQSKKKLTVDGIAGPATFTALCK
jgi:hypothetical protein